MEIDEIITLFDYNCWATEKILISTSELSVDQFTGKISCSHGSLRGTLVHILSAERIWRLRCREGTSPSQFIDENLYPDPASLRSPFVEEQSQMRRYLMLLDGSKLHSTIEYRTTKGAACKNTLWHLILHLFNHGTHHRSEAAEILSRYGRSPGDLDFILYLRNRKQLTGTEL